MKLHSFLRAILIHRRASMVALSPQNKDWCYDHVGFLWVAEPVCLPPLCQRNIFTLPRRYCPLTMLLDTAGKRGYLLNRNYGNGILFPLPSKVCLLSYSGIHRLATILICFCSSPSWEWCAFWILSPISSASSQPLLRIKMETECGI